MTAAPAAVAAAVTAVRARATAGTAPVAAAVAAAVPRPSTSQPCRRDASAALERRLVVVEGRHAVVVEGPPHVVGERPGREQPIVEGHVRRLERDGRGAGLFHARVPGDIGSRLRRGDGQAAGLQQVLEERRVPPLRAHDVRERAHVAVVLQDPAVHRLAPELVLEGLLDRRLHAAAQRRGPLRPAGRRRGVARVGGRRLGTAAGSRSEHEQAGERAAGNVFVGVIFTGCLPVANRANRRPGTSGDRRVQLTVWQEDVRSSRPMGRLASTRPSKALDHLVEPRDPIARSPAVRRRANWCGRSMLERAPRPGGSRHAPCRDDRQRSTGAAGVLKEIER